MIYSNFTAVLDIGSAQISLAIGTKTTEGKLNIIDVESCPSSSIKYGKIVNESVVAKEVQALILKVQQRHKVIIEQVYVSTSGVPLYSERVSLTKALGNGSIVTEEVLSSLNGAEELKLKDTKDRLLHKEALIYRLDDEKQEMVVGKSCRRIEADYLLVKAETDSLERIENSLDIAKVKMAEMFLAPQVIAEAILTEEEKKTGVAAVEIANASTKIAIYKEDKLQYIATLPLGYRLIIKDLSNALNISYALAETLFQHKEVGAVYASFVKDADMELSTKSDIKKIYPTRFIVEIIEARLEEILLNIKNHLAKSGFINLIISGMVFTGNVVKLKNLSQFVSLKTNLNVRIANLAPSLSPDSKHQLSDADAEICGMLTLGKSISKKEDKKEKKEAAPAPSAKPKTPSGEKKGKKQIFRGMRNLFEEIFDEEDTSL